MALPDFASNAVVAKWVTLQVLHERRASLILDDMETTVQSLLNTVNTHVVNVLGAADQSSEVDFRSQWLSVLRSATTGGAAAVDDLFDEIEHRLKTVTSLPESLTDSVFEHVMRLTRSAYSEHGIDGPTSDPQLDVRWDAPKLNTLSESYVRTVRTINASDGKCEVSLKLPISGMNTDMFSSLEYVLLHECVCHVFQGPFNVSRPDSSPKSLFQEGWMDFVTLVLYEDHLIGLPYGPLCLAPTVAGSATARRDAARQAHRDRRERVEGDARWASRQLGAEAADNLQSALHGLPELSDSSRSLLLRLSLALNGSDVPVGRRDKVAMEVQNCLSGWELSRHAEVFEAVRAWEESGDVTTFVSSFS